VSLSAGSRLGPYEIVSPLGAGGMGEVYRAKDPRLGREVAVKVLPASFSKDPDRLRRFEHEARAAGVLNHPNITAVYDIGTADGAPYVVTELLEGETLRSRLAAGALSPRKALEYAIQMAHGLAAAHEKGIVHRDLKPENIFVTNDGRVKILDFGLAKLTQSEDGVDLTGIPTASVGTEPGVVMGTLSYMSPEQVRGKPVDHRSDIFALGAILWEMLSGRRAFQGETAADTMTAILTKEPPELSAIDKNIHPGLARIVRHCVEKNSGERFQSARDVAFDLEALTDVSPPGAAARPVSAPRRRTWFGIAFAALLAGAIALGYALARLTERASTSHNVTFHQKTFQPQPIFVARFAPDGRTICYSAAPRGNSPELYSISPDYPESRALGLSETHLLSISSQSELAVLTRARWLDHRVFIGTLARLPLGGGAPREILENVREADWSPDGSNLAVIREVNGRDRLEFPLARVLYETGGYVSDLRVSPKADRIAFFEHPIKWDDRGSVAVVDRNGKKTVLSESYSTEQGLAWSPDGKEVLFSAGGSFSSNKVYAVSLSGRRRIALESAGGLTIQDVSRDGSWLTTRDDSRMGILVRAPGEKTERDLSWLDYSIFPVLSGDGRTLLFTDISEPAGRYYMVCLRKTDGSPVVRLGEGWGADLSPDGKWVLAVVPTSPQQLRLYPIGAGAARTLDRGNIEGYEFYGSWFRDGRRVCVCGHEPGRGSRCYVQQLAGGPPRPVTPERTTAALPSPDGQFVLARSTSPERSAALYPLSGGPPRPLPFLTSDDGLVRWAPDGRSLWIWHRAAGPSRIERLDLGNGQRETVAEFAPRETAGLLTIGRFAIADDPSVYAYGYRESLSHLFVVEGAR
jgi:serine/threonine protein kinase/Tol biopolymer transport system component